MSNYPAGIRDWSFLDAPPYCTCDYCGRERHEDDTVELDSLIVCSSCIEEPDNYCPLCDHWIGETNLDDHLQEEHGTSLRKPALVLCCK